MPLPVSPVTSTVTSQLAAFRERMGLNDPLWLQYLHFLKCIVTLHLGTSLISKRSIRGDLALRLPRTFELITASMLLAIMIGIPLGVVAASYRNRLPDVVVSLISASPN